MNSLYPVELELEAFRSFVDRVLIPFPKDGAVLISGETEDKTTSSGIGKSAILHAIAHALGICSIPSTELKSWYSKKKMYVRLRLTDGFNVYDIIRNPKLSLVINGEEYKGTAAGAKEELEKLVTVSYDLVKSLIYRPQRERGVFLNFTDASYKSFLTSVLDIGSVEKTSEDLTNELSALTKKIEMSENILASIETTLKTLRPVNESEIQNAQKVYDDACNAVKVAESGNGDPGGVLKAELSAINEGVAKIMSAQNEALTAKNQNAALRMSIEEKQQQIKKLESGKCYTCEQEWQQNENQKEALNQDILNCIESMKANIAVIKNAEAYFNEELSSKYEQRKQEIHNILAQANAPIETARRERDLSKQLLDKITYEYNSFNSETRRAEEKGAEIAAWKAEQHLLSHCCSIIGRDGFLGNIFDEVLGDIRTKANNLMKHAPNIDTFTLDISSDTVTAKGKVNKKIKPSVYRDGVERNIKALSGGQIAATELCTDLGVVGTIRSRTDSNLGWMMLDEAMDGLDVETKKSMIEIIKAEVGGLIIVVDHSTEIKESFDKVIEVKYDGKRSTIA